MLPSLAAEYKLSIRGVARGIRVDHSHLVRIVAKEMPASGSIAAKIAELFELPVDFFPEYRIWRVEQAIRDDPAQLERLYDRLPPP
jgi:hypothetical protein